MDRFRIEFMDKGHKDRWLPRLFEILHHNMAEITPSGVTYEEEREEWLSAVGPALDKDPRQILLMFAGERLAGYFQYYVNGGMFMVEEIQILPEYQGTTLLCVLFRYLGTVLPKGIETIGAYAHRLNVRSQSIMKKLGMKQIGDNEGDFFLYQGDFAPLAHKYRKRT